VYFLIFLKIACARSRVISSKKATVVAKTSIILANISVVL